MTIKPPTRRYIAGAVCPRCGQMDKIVIDMETDQRECVACGFKEQRPSNPAASEKAQALELPTRVSRAVSRRVETPAEPVTLVQPDTAAEKSS